jgi:hypothetical protein
VSVRLYKKEKKGKVRNKIKEEQEMKNTTKSFTKSYKFHQATKVQNKKTNTRNTHTTPS